MDKCNFCDKTLYPGIGRRPLSDGKIICDKCTNVNMHLKDQPGVVRRWTVWGWYYYYV